MAKGKKKKKTCLACSGTIQQFLNYSFGLHSLLISFNIQHIAKFLIAYIGGHSYTYIQNHLRPPAVPISIEYKAVLREQLSTFCISGSSRLVTSIDLDKVSFAKDITHVSVFSLVCLTP